jgi:ribose transport system permease protein
MALVRDDFLSEQTLLAVAFRMSVIGVLAVGQALVVISGGFLDLSQPAALILSGLVVVRLMEAGVPIVIVIVAGVAAGLLFGLTNGIIIVLAKINPVIVTLGTNFIGLASLFLVFQVAQIPRESDLYAFGRESFLGVPGIWFPMVALILIVGFFLPRTVRGRHVTAVGGNKVAAVARGISLKKTRLATFAASGAAAGIAAVLFTASRGPFNAGSANTLLLPTIAAVILAGISLAGGRGNIWLLLLSVGFLATVPTSLVFFGLESDWQLLVQGSILVVAVAADGYRSRQAA